MIYQIIVTDQFEKDVQYYKRKKKYTKIDDDIEEIAKQLEQGNFLGDPIAELKLPERHSVFKVRVINSSANVGKSNGFRLIYYVIKNDFEIYLLTIYSKKDQEDISDSEIRELITMYCS